MSDWVITSEAIRHGLPTPFKTPYATNRGVSLLRANNLFAFLTTEPNRLVGEYHPKAMPVILTTSTEIVQWMNAPTSEALALQRPLPDDALVIVARGSKTDGER